jgi:hypothetical protein
MDDSDTRSPLRPPGARTGSPESFSLGVDALNGRATGDESTQVRRVNEAVESAQFRPVRPCEVEVKRG